MESNHLILALGKTLPESVLQGAAVYLLLQLLFLCDKNSMPKFRFNLLFASGLLLMFGFIFTFFYHYQQIIPTSFDTVLLGNRIPNHLQATIAKPDLWLQFGFWTSRYANLITGFYLIGLSFCMLKLIFGLININWFRSHQNLRLDYYLTEISQRLNSNFRSIKTVSVFLSGKIQVPMTIGFIKPIIVFPFALINHLSVAQTEAILLHELAHIKRNDYLLNILLGIVQSFLFFNPAIWLIEREISKYREQCCDDLVIDNTADKLAYAKALLLIEENRASQLSFALSSNGKKFNLLDRIKRITYMKTNEPSPQNKLIVLLLALITIGLTVAWNMPVKEVWKNNTLRHFKLEETKRNGSKLEIDAEKVIMSKSPNQSQIKFFSDKIELKPNNRSNKKYIISGKRIEFNPDADTSIKSKNKFKIVMEDSLGNKKEYNSIEELPASAKKEFLKENENSTGFQGFHNPRIYFDTTNFNFNKKYYNSPAFKQQIAKLTEQSEVLSKQAKKQFDSPEFKKQMEQFKVQSKLIAEETRKQFDNPKFKKEMQELQKQAEKMSLYYNGPQWKKQQLLMKKQIDSARLNWKKSMDLQFIPVEPGLPNQPVAPPDL